ncbi:hypothetical protein JVT61DRAFT_13983 [Boletus reticuloceps]|uniref:BAG domain-containing protein n=1 Tax=Boletus reticuloceps TaxID=495285 RepID=A0A8I3AAT4_9AGAM|nr:hypothetical protein JVT61DRAFT_13983 [Boletus reticuloceps]
MIHVKWDRDVLHFPLPPLTTPLGQLRADLAAYTQLPVESFKLVYKGAVMKEDGAPLSTYKLKENATIALIGGHTLSSETSSTSATAAAPRMPNPKTKSTSTPPTEESTIVAIRHELERVREMLVPDVDAFVQALASSTGNGDENGNAGGVPESHPGPKATPLDHSRLSELLLQSLLRLDALHVSGLGADWPDARVQRKAAVREVQGVLDRLDEAWALR